MEKWLLLAILSVFLYHWSVGQEERICYHVDDMYEVWIVQCFGVDYTNAFQVTLILIDTKRRASFVDIKIDVSNSIGDALPEDVFEGYKIEAVIMKNCGFTSFPFQLLTSLPSKMLKLDLSNNVISDIDFRRLNDLPYANHLIDLKLGSNQITSLPEDAFYNFTHLITLELQDNVLLELVDNTFRGLVKLRAMHLYENQIERVGRQAFAALDNLHFLAIDLNRINFLEKGTFSVEDQPNLRTLSLEGNPFYCNCSMEWLKSYLESIHYMEVSGATCIYPRIAKFGDVDFCASENEVISKV